MSRKHLKNCPSTSAQARTPRTLCPGSSMPALPSAACHPNHLWVHHQTRLPHVRRPLQRSFFRAVESPQVSHADVNLSPRAISPSRSAIRHFPRGKSKIILHTAISSGPVSPAHSSGISAIRSSFHMSQDANLVYLHNFRSDWFAPVQICKKPLDSPCGKANSNFPSWPVVTRENRDYRRRIDIWGRSFQFLSVTPP